MFICPVCGKRLKMGHKTAVCQNGHSFDKAKSGYINLLMSQKSALKRHGDDKLMVKARAEFLERGHYSPLAEKIFKSALPYGKKGGAVLDADALNNLYGIDPSLIAQSASFTVAAGTFPDEVVMVEAVSDEDYSKLD